MVPVLRVWSSSWIRVRRSSWTRISWIRIWISHGIRIWTNSWMMFLGLGFGFVNDVSVSVPPKLYYYCRDEMNQINLDMISRWWVNFCITRSVFIYDYLLLCFYECNILTCRHVKFSECKWSVGLFCVLVIHLYHSFCRRYWLVFVWLQVQTEGGKG